MSEELQISETEEKAAEELGEAVAQKTITVCRARRQRSTAVRYVNTAAVAKSRILTKPNGKITIDAQYNSYGSIIGVTGKMQGWRKTMEDSCTLCFPICNERRNTAIVGVFDGHRGADASEFVKDTLLLKLSEIMCEREAKKTVLSTDERIRNAFEITDKLLYEKHTEYLSTHSNDDEVTTNVEDSKKLVSIFSHPPKKVSPGLQGSTAHVVIITEDEYYFCNLGDSRGYLLQCRSNKLYNEGVYANDSTDQSVVCLISTPTHSVRVLKMSEDHRIATNEAERNRLRESGCSMENDRVEGKLGVTRSFGDFDLKTPMDDEPDKKRGIVPTPEIIRYPAPRYNPDIFSLFANQSPSDKNSYNVRNQNIAAINFDIIFVGCDGVWELQSAEVVGKRFIDSLEAAFKLIQENRANGIKEPVSEENTESKSSPLVVGENLEKRLSQFGIDSTDCATNIVKAIESALKLAVAQSLYASCAPQADERGICGGCDNLCLASIFVLRGL